MSTSLAVILGCAIVSAAIKAAGPIALGGRELPAWADNVIVLLAPALLAALVVTAVLAEEQEIGVGPETAGVLAGALVMWRFGSVVGCVVAAAVVTAAVRAL